MEIRKEIQIGRVYDEVQALIAVTLPILQGTLLALKKEVINEVGGFDNIKLFMLPRLYRPGSGDCGICFEYAVHDAIVNKVPSVIEKIDEALSKHCRIKGDNPSSILFGAEKTGTIQLIKSVKEFLTNESRLLSGKKGQPVRLKKHIDSVAAAFRRPGVRATLPNCINGLWKADLFVGQPQSDQWVGVTVKINPDHLEHAGGLRVGVVPSKQGRNDNVIKHETKNLIICPLPYDGAFMEVFYQGWQIVQQFLHADAHVPKEVSLPRPASRQVCRFLEERRQYGVLEVIESLRPLAQPELLNTEIETGDITLQKGLESSTGAIIAPFSQK